MKRLGPDAIERGVAALERFRQIAEISGATVRAVATSAVREAENADDVRPRAAARGRHQGRGDLRVRGGAARSIWACCRPCRSSTNACCCATSAAAHRSVDRAGHRPAGRSEFKLGAMRLTNRFFAGEPPASGCGRLCRRYVGRRSARSSGCVAKHGSTLRSARRARSMQVVRLAAAAASEPPLDVCNGVAVTAARSRDVHQRCSYAAPADEQPLELPGLDEGGPTSSWPARSSANRSIDAFG